ncbi:MAG TPA: helix-turn-helix domain-containing protein [Streptosporangiaceae bacterium]
MAGQRELSFAGLVRQLRAGAGLTQEELAQAAGLPVRTLSDLERGVSRTAHKDTAGRLAGALGLAGPAELDGGDGGTVVISAVAGMAGVGKTALAVHWARKVAHRFPGGQLYVNLCGYDPGPAVAPQEAAGWFLTAMGVPAEQIPAQAQARFGLYRSVLAGRQMLIVLDNARDAAQVRPLLPGTAGCLTIVTSRSALAGLAAAEGARPLQLGLMGAEEAARLLAARLGPERVAAEPGAVTELAARCGYLPLALGVMAARAAADPSLPLGVLAGRLAGASGTGAAGGRQPPGGKAGGGWRCWKLATRRPACASCCPGPTASCRGPPPRCSRYWGCTAGPTSRSRPRPAWPGSPGPARRGRWPNWPTPAWPPGTAQAGT